MSKRKFLLLGGFVAAALVVTIQRGVYAFPNDYAIFRASFWNLIHHRDLYVVRLDQARDYFKYSPTFALLFAPFALLPFVPGLLLWNVCNAVAIWFALNTLLPEQESVMAQVLVFLPTLRSMQSSQSNSLVAALIVFAFICYERGWLWRAGTAVGLGASIKIFPVAALTFALPRRDRVRAIAIAIFFAAALLVLPLAAVAPAELVAQYRWWALLEKTEATLVGSSAMLLLRDAGFTWSTWPIQLAASFVVLGTLFFRRRAWDKRGVRLQFLALILVFCVVFNHRAERQSSVIAICGMIVWLLSSQRATWRTVVFTVVYALVALTGADVVPDAIKHALIPEVRFTIPLCVGWLAILRDLLVGATDRPLLAETGERNPIALQ